MAKKRKGKKLLEQLNDRIDRLHCMFYPNNAIFCHERKDGQMCQVCELKYDLGIGTWKKR